MTANYIVIGNIGNIGDRRFWINVNLINVTTGENEKSISKEYNSLPKLLDDTRNLILAFIEPEVYNTGEYIIITPKDFSKFDFIGTGYSNYSLKYTDATYFNASSLPITIIGNRGNKIGFFWDINYYIPFFTSERGTILQFSDYNFTFGVSIAAGISTIVNITENINLLLGIGSHHDQHQYWHKEKNGPGLLVMTFGTSAPIYLFYRFNNNYYLGLASILSYDFLPIDLSEAGQLDGLGFDIRLVFGSAK